MIPIFFTARLLIDRMFSLANFEPYHKGVPPAILTRESCDPLEEMSSWDRFSLRTIPGVEGSLPGQPVCLKAFPHV